MKIDEYKIHDIMKNADDDICMCYKITKTCQRKTLFINIPTKSKKLKNQTSNFSKSPIQGEAKDPYIPPSLLETVVAIS